MSDASIYMPIGELLMREAMRAFEIRSLKGRSRSAIEARWALMLVMSRNLCWSSTRIGRRLGMNHSTVKHGIKQAQDLYGQANYFAEAVDHLAGFTAGSPA